MEEMTKETHSNNEYNSISREMGEPGFPGGPVNPETTLERLFAMMWSRIDAKMTVSSVTWA